MISRDQYHKGGVLSSMPGVDFYTLLAALFREADSDNLEILKEAFPGVHEKLIERYNAPLSMLPGETAVIDGTKMSQTKFKNIGIDDFFIYLGVKYRKVIQTQDVLGTYNAISITGPVGRRIIWLGENTVVEKRHEANKR